MAKLPLNIKDVTKIAATISKLDPRVLAICGAVYVVTKITENKYSLKLSKGDLNLELKPQEKIETYGDPSDEFEINIIDGEYKEI